MKKNKLVIEYEYAFHLLGITSSVKFYKLAWSINQTLGINLIKAPEYKLDLLQEPLLFEVYTFGEPDIQFRLFRNRSVSQESQFLIPEYPHFDYIIKLPSDSQSFALKEMVKVLRDVDLIEYIGALDVKTLKSRDNFLE